MLRGKVAVVTGSTGGAGLRIACKLAAAGADLAINGAGDTTEAEMLGRQLSDTYGVRVAFSPAHASEPRGAAGLIGDATRVFGRIDILVNNAGVQDSAAVYELPVEQWYSTIANNLTAVFLTTRAVLPQMLRQNWGRIINVASTFGFADASNGAAYVASMHGVAGLTKCVALETAATGITCNAICPISLLSASQLQRTVEASAVSRQIDLTDIGTMPLEGARPPAGQPRGWLGDLVKFLCSDAGAHLNGVALPVDCGRFS